ncbi:YeeE/YedE family protein [Alkalimarinus alittae]|uniref:YeeE/YedE family protein n=1 Tax=Alkalimarinus alittae TaxID=2961619 RepID=A0ABY6N3T6_9ALTE|nr:YeeE/YedE thiosulfate transporter family protein [Alkalimarinus alittae]UZE96647.1 YeeE/YedE family protein [Alkalimarinus alittae]
MNPDFINATIGGVMIAFSVIIMMSLLGKVTGISGIIWQSIKFDSAEPGRLWRPAFIVGLIIGPLLVHFLLGWEFPAPQSDNVWLIIVSGLLVGAGTQLGSGCTSGHGICGIGRFSSRSIVATVTFMAAGILTVAIVNAL